MVRHPRPSTGRSRGGLLLPVVLTAVIAGLCAFAPAPLMSEAQAQTLPGTLVTKLKDAVVLIAAPAVAASSSAPTAKS